MNGTYYQNPTFPTIDNNYEKVNYSNNDYSSNDEISMEQSFIENILRHNKGKKVKAYVSFPDSNEWKDKVFEGIVEQAGRDHLIIRDVNDNKWYLILMIYLDYVEFDEKIDYTEKKYFSSNS